MPSNEKLASNVADIIKNGGVPDAKLREVLCNNIPFEALVTLSADLEDAWNEVCAESSVTLAHIENVERALAEARPTHTRYQFGTQAS